ncbi:hypothetical protein PYCCODRAFT_1424314 [Trametes coccinea BRFM310]|uniref:RlpA-like protein double-psi beta-barrel domain-containing protein n=1 Tax=Trametes coccinea (strain BRFM310) TaxID=1353009 RepID=A0A1Y2ISC7_TRAC3|nr:hypothetical protein PYCCODRAFT_1424314 [Trametes coccinea BRFM310]
MFANTLVFPVLAAVLAASGVRAQIYGDATYYYPNGGYGACGAPLQNTDYIVALSADQYANGANCWRHIGVNYNGKFVDATIGDLCPGCAFGSIDLSPVAFEALASLDKGRIPVSWNFE